MFIFLVRFVNLNLSFIDFKLYQTYYACTDVIIAV